MTRQCSGREVGFAQLPFSDDRKGTFLQTDSEETLENIKRSIAAARAGKPAYEEFYPFLEALFLIQTQVKGSLKLRQIELSPELVQTKWAEGFSLLRRWDFPVDPEAAEMVLAHVKGHIPESNRQLQNAHSALTRALAGHPEQKPAVWKSFLQHEWEPWEEWVETEGIDISSLLFLARSCLRPSLEWVAKDLLDRYPLPATWLRGYCPVCGSLPALLFLQGQGERMAYCSWCGTQWGLHRLQCPQCDNRYHESLGYLYVEAEPFQRVQYCRLCKHYFKLIDTRERLDFPCLPLEEWTTLHLDLLAQKEGWKLAASPAPALYADPPGKE
jgi:FdhE protein